MATKHVRTVTKTVTRPGRAPRTVTRNIDYLEVKGVITALAANAAPGRVADAILVIQEPDLTIYHVGVNLRDLEEAGTPGVGNTVWAAVMTGQAAYINFAPDDDSGIYRRFVRLAHPDLPFGERLLRLASTTKETP
jgi:hypothetical protein